MKHGTLKILIVTDVAAEAAQIALRTVRQWREPLPEEVVFCCFSAADLDVYRELLK